VRLLLLIRHSLNPTFDYFFGDDVEDVPMFLLARCCWPILFFFGKLLQLKCCKKRFDLAACVVASVGIFCPLVSVTKELRGKTAVCHNRLRYIFPQCIKMTGMTKGKAVTC
jgi:hypothetical protein